MTMNMTKPKSMLARRILVMFFLLFCLMLFSPSLLSHVLPNKGFNLLFGYILPLVLVLSPLYPVFARTVPLEGAGGQQQAARVRSLSRGLWIGVAVSVAALAVAEAVAPNVSIVTSLIAFCALQFAFTIPLMREKNPACKPVFMPETQRAASLTPRHTGVLPTWAWLLVWGVWIAAVISCLPFLLLSGTPGGSRSDIIILLCAAAAPLALAPFAIHWWPQSPEPMDSAGNAELADTYRHLRSIRAWSIWAVAIVWAAIFCTRAILTAWRTDQATLRVVDQTFLPIFIATMFWFQLKYHVWRRRATALLRSLTGEPKNPS